VEYQRTLYRLEPVFVPEQLNVFAYSTFSASPFY
jgi:hypothetical protein